MSTISENNKLATILDFNVCKQLVKNAIDKGESCVILCPHYSINVQSKYEDGEELGYDLDELEEFIGETLEVSDFDDLICDLSYLQEKYFVSVGNIGNIECDDEESAKETFEEYKKQSINNYGRAAGESVTLFKGEDILMEYIGTIDQTDND